MLSLKSCTNTDAGKETTRNEVAVSKDPCISLGISPEFLIVPEPSPYAIPIAKNMKNNIGTICCNNGELGIKPPYALRRIELLGKVINKRTAMNTRTVHFTALRPLTSSE